LIIITKYQAIDTLRFRGKNNPLVLPNAENVAVMSYNIISLPEYNMTQSKNCPFIVNTEFELENITPTPVNNGI
jgi:hypothetical protein